jgi:hypothetical protein
MFVRVNPVTKEPVFLNRGTLDENLKMRCYGQRINPKTFEHKFALASSSLK